MFDTRWWWFFVKDMRKLLDSINDLRFNALISNYLCECGKMLLKNVKFNTILILNKKRRILSLVSSLTN